MTRSTSTGLYTRLSNSFSQPVTGTTIDPTDADSYFDDIDEAMNSWIATSTSSLAIGAGAKTFTIQTTKAFIPGTFVQAFSQADHANYMNGTVTSYNTGTGALVVDVVTTGGSGTFADWLIMSSGARGGTGATGATGPGYLATSTSSVLIGSSGTKTFTTQAGLAYSAGARVRASDAGAPSTNYMEGVVSSYSGTTLAFTADRSVGSGTLTDWSINLAGDKGADGSGSPANPSATIGLSAVNGAAMTYIRSDGAPALDQGIAPTWTGTHKFTNAPVPTTNDSTALGTASLQWSDLFLASGAVVNYANGNFTITHSSGALTMSGTLSLGTSNAFTCGTIELGAASDTTISRSAAGVIAVEGVPLYSNIPQNSQSAAYTLVLADAQKHIFHPSADTTARVWTIPANSSVAYPVGTAITFINQNAGGVITIAITTDTMRLAGAGTTGSRSLAANGVATAIKVATAEWLISGTGLT